MHTNFQDNCYDGWRLLGEKKYTNLLIMNVINKCNYINLYVDCA